MEVVVVVRCAALKLVTIWLSRHRHGGYLSTFKKATNDSVHGA